VVPSGRVQGTLLHYRPGADSLKIATLFRGLSANNQPCEVGVQIGGYDSTMLGGRYYLRVDDSVGGMRMAEDYIC
jgi:hypothetical protein